MDREVNLGFRMAMEIMLAGMVLWVIVLFTQVSKTTYITRENNRVLKINTEAYAQLYEYNSRSVTGSDVVDAIIMFARNYDFEVILSGGDTLKFNLDEENSINWQTGERYGDSLWSKEVIAELMGTDITSNFQSEIIRDTSNTYIIGLKFRKGV